MKNSIKKTVGLQMLASGLLVFGLSLFLSIGEMSAQNNEWKTSAPNPPVGLSTDAEAMVVNGGRSYDLDQFTLDVEIEKRAVIEGNYSNGEEVSRLKILEAASIRANQGMTIEASFNQAYVILQNSIEINFPSVDLVSIRNEYIDKFEQ